MNPEGDVPYVAPLEKADIRFDHDRSKPLFDISRLPLFHFHHYERVHQGISKQVCFYLSVV